ncbi:transcriptional regulator [Candidatus Gastranaerophilus sp. (ex Termes propinquus)]|nr:transcriptional regulator [Candidatus Gastranaerophilus sp. (ex Termes propinquus)]
MAIIYRADLANALNVLVNSFVGNSSSRLEFSIPFSPKRQNILVMGVDASDNPEDPFVGNRTDSMFVVSIAQYGKNVNIVSIPRDSKVYISGTTKPDKINHAFAKGGVNLAIKTVEDTFGIRIDHYIAISTDALVKFVDTIGGVPIYVEYDMKYQDRSQGLNIDIRKGQTVLDGKGAEAYLRYRKDALGDIGRIH